MSPDNFLLNNSKVYLKTHNYLRSAVSKILLVFLFLLTYTAKSQIPLVEHPRPDFNRPNWENLNGLWDFKFDPDDKGIKEQWYKGTNFDQKITVPFPWGSNLSKVKDEANIGWYNREINVSADWKTKKTFITVGASDWETSVWLDGIFVGKHQGGYVPFSFNLTPYLKYGQNQKLTIRVDDDAGDPKKFKRGYTLYGKQGYGNARGIWQTVYLEARGNNFIDAIHFTPDIDNKKVNVTAYLDKYATKELPLKIKIKTDKGFINHDIIFKFGQLKRKFDIDIPDMKLWSLEDPYLYDVEIKLEDDYVKSYFGMRKISIINLPGTEYPYVALNNKPIYLQLALDQSYHPDGYYAFPSDKFIKEEILRSKSIGLNGIRIHIKAEVPRKLFWADKLGLLVVEDLPNSWGDPDKFMRNESEYTLKEMIKRDYNHPSIFSWVLFNEQWGLSTKNDSDDNKENKSEILSETYNWVTSMYYLAKSMDESRLIEDNSLCCGGLHTATDINSWHVYLPGYAWENYLKDQSEKNFKGSTHLYYDGFKQENQPFVNSESGNVWGYKGSTGDIDWSYDYHRMINSFRKFPEVAGWLYTEHHDVINEWNGYWKFDRSEKITGLDKISNGMTLNDFHSPVYLSTGVEICKSVKGGDEVQVPLFISSMTQKDFGDELVIDYELIHTNSIAQEYKITSGEFNIKYQPWKNESLSPINLKMPQASGLSKLILTLKTLDGEVLHKNFLHFEVSSDEKLKNLDLLSFDPNSFSNSSWTKKSWAVFGNKKMNGTGNGFFEYEIIFPKKIKSQKYKDAYFIIEASAKQLFDKDKDEKDYVDAGIDYMKGSKVSPSKNPNSYPMTDSKQFQSKIQVLINEKIKMELTLEDDPADHRGVLSWHYQKRSKTSEPPKLNEAGSYGYIIKTPISKAELENSIKKGKMKIKLRTDGEGGIAIYGKSFGRYPLNPTLVLQK